MDTNSAARIAPSNESESLRKAAAFSPFCKQRRRLYKEAFPEWSKCSVLEDVGILPGR